MHLITKDKDDLIKKLRLEVERVTEDSENISRTVAGVSARVNIDWWLRYGLFFADSLSHRMAVLKTRWNMHVLHLN